MTQPVISDFRFEIAKEGASLKASLNQGGSCELLSFLYIARGSAGEVRSMYCLLERRPWMKDGKFQIANLKSMAESCSRQLRAWAESLQDSEIKGQRHLSQKERERLESHKRADAFQKKLLNMLPARASASPRSRGARTHLKYLKSAERSRWSLAVPQGQFTGNEPWP